jgi:hypothetical protein
MSSVESGAPTLTIEDVERSGEWVRGYKNPSGISLQVLYNWRDKGCPYVEGRKLDVKPVLVTGSGWNAPRLVYFFSRSQLEQVAPLFHAKGEGRYSRRGKTGGSAAVLKARYAAQEVVEEGGRRLLSPAAARKYLGVSEATLLRWSSKGCPHWPGGRALPSEARDVAGVLTRFYSAEDLNALRRLLDSLPAHAAGPGEIGLDEAARRLGLDPQQLRYKKTRDLLGVRGSLRLVRGSDGRPKRRLVFSAAEVDRLAQGGLPPCGLPRSAGRHQEGRRGRGRPKGSVDPEVQERYGRLIDECRAGVYPTIQAAADAYDMQRPTVSRILKAAGVEL